jgi:hypothetical protein
MALRHTMPSCQCDAPLYGKFTMTKPTKTECDEREFSALTAAKTAECFNPRARDERETKIS